MNKLNEHYIFVVRIINNYRLILFLSLNFKQLQKKKFVLELYFKPLSTILQKYFTNPQPSSIQGVESRNYSMNFQNQHDIILDFIEEQTKDDGKMQKRLSIQSLKDQSHINFNDLLEREWTLTDQSQTFFHSKQLLPDQVIPELLQANNNISILKARQTGKDPNKNDSKRIFYQPEMKSINTIFESPQYVEDIQMYLESDIFLMFIRIIVITNFIGLFLMDYQFRLLQAHGKKTQLIAQNAIALSLQTFSNCVFTLEIILQLFSAKTNFSNPWIILNIIGTLACWATIFFDMLQYDSAVLFEILNIIRIIRGLRIIQVFQNLKNLFETFLGTVPSLNKIFFPLLVFMSFYAITGQHLFLGSNQTKCRNTQTPVDGTWSQYNWDLCGASFRTCPAQTTCGNPIDYGLPPMNGQQIQRSKENGIVGFNNFFSAMLTTYHYIFLSNWTGIIFKFSRYINPYLSTFYFVSMAVVLFFILANLIFISLSKAYIQKQKILQKKRENTFNNQQQQSSAESSQLSHRSHQPHLSQQTKLLLRVVEISEVILIIVQSIVIVIDYKDMPSELKKTLSLIDFTTSTLAIGLIIIRFIILKLKIVKKFQNIVDLVLIVCFVADIIYCISNQLSIIYIQSYFSAVIRGMKIVRLIKVLYISESIFKYQRNIVNLFFQTLKNMRYFLLLLSCIVLIFSFIGEMLFSFRVRFTPNRSVNLLEGQPFVVNFQSSYKSIIATVLLFQNQRWTETMYMYYHARGFWGILFFACVAFFVHLMLTRLFMAVFLCYFRRDLEKKFEQKKRQETQMSLKDIVESYNQKKRQQQTIIDQYNESDNNRRSQSNSQSNQQTKQNNKLAPSSTGRSSMTNQKQEKLFWVLNRNSCPLQLIKIFHNSKAFYYFTLFAILSHVITIIFRSNVDSAQKTRILDSIQNISISIYVLQLILGILSYGLYFEQNSNSYLKRSHFNKLNLMVVILFVISLLPFIDILYRGIIKRLIVIKIFTVLKTRNKQMDIILKAIAQIFKNFLRIVVIYTLFLIMASVIPLKLLKSSLFNCYNAFVFSQTAPAFQNPVDCMSAGGDWVQDPQNFNNVFSAVVLMYQVVTSQSWTYFIQLTVPKNIHWDIFWVLMFFFYNVCLLNIFVGLTIQTYIDLKDKAYKLNLLRPSQKGWILIKNCINQLVPLPTIGSTSYKGFVRQISFKIISNQYYNDLIDVLAYANIILYAMTIYRSSQQYIQILMYFKVGVLMIFCSDTILKLYAIRRQYFYLDNSKVELVGFVYVIFYGFISTTINLGNQEQRIIDFFLVVFLFLRCKKFLFRFTWSKTLINSVIQILPKCIQIGSFLFIVLFTYVAVGLQMFKHVKPSSKNDGYNTGFYNFYTGIMTLLKIASNQAWFQQVSTFLRDKQSNDFCYQIVNQEQADLYSGLGCGYSYFSIPFFISYHMAMALLIFNLLIATMISAYDQNYEKEYNSVNVFQLQDCLQLWKKYDPKGTGVIPYKKFWKLSSQIGILFGISKKKLIKSKQKFLEQLDIPICQSIRPQDTSVLCYRFHDVITKFSKIKLQVSLDKGDQQSHSIQFDIHPMIEQQIKDFTIKIPEELYKNYKQFKNYTSGEMKYFFGLLRKLRSWKTHSKSKGQIKVSKLSRIIKVAMEKKVQEENLKNLLAFCTGQQNKQLVKKRQEGRNNTGAVQMLTGDMMSPLSQQDEDIVSNQSQSELVDSQHHSIPDQQQQYESKGMPNQIIERQDQQQDETYSQQIKEVFDFDFQEENNIEESKEATHTERKGEQLKIKTHFKKKDK